jgi:Leucine-rich repeat (LRR) protein
LRLEFGGLEPHEKEAAAIAVATTLGKASPTANDLLDQDLDAEKLKALLLERDPGRPEAELLGDGATALYGFALEQACHLTVETVASLPQFEATVLREILERETDIAAKVAVLVERIPAVVPGADPASAFEQRYRYQISRKLDQVELFGLSTRRYKPRYSLSVAYISLNAAVGGDDARGPVRVEEMLREGRRFLIRGEAGSGKTTLLQWIATQVAREADWLPDPWLDKVPFFVRLRSYAGRDLPAPERFIEFTSPMLVDEMPDGWARKVLAEGRAFVLVDGVDELAEEERDAARDWLFELIDLFPEASYAVTSRPPAVPEEWLAERSFRAAELLPMDSADISIFLEHWHAAAERLIVDADERSELRRFSQRLMVSLRENRSLHDLASSPLLCAMLCVLNWDRRSALPSDRWELYRLALETLIHRRELERGTATSRILDLRVADLRILLQDLAYWLLRNQLTDVDKNRAIGHLGGKIRDLPHVTATAREVFEYLLLRSGVLREPVEGRIDFVHRTFQEYLAARQAIDNDDVEAILAQAHLDHWREVVTLAAGHANRQQRASLVDGLLDRGDGDPENRHRLYLLAVGCLEIGRELPEYEQERLEQRLNTLVPPRSLADAAPLASAGDLAVPLLSGHSDRSPEVVAACVRTLSLVRGPRALEVIREYGSDGRPAVVAELIQAWQSFDPEAYARDVIGDSPLFDQGLKISAPDYLPSLRWLKNLRTLTCDCRIGSPSEWGAPDAFSSLSGLRELRFERATLSLLYLSESVRGLLELEVLDLTGAGSLRDIAPVEDLVNLRRLALDECLALADLGPVGGKRRLEWLSARGTSVREVTQLADLPRLEYLDLVGTPVVNGEALGRLPALRELRVGGIESVFSPGGRLPSMAPDVEREVSIVASQARREVQRALQEKESQDRDATRRTRQEFLKEHEDLFMAPFRSPIVTLGVDPGFPSLRTVRAINCPRLNHLKALAGARSMREIYMSDLPCESIADLGHFPSLELLELESWHRLRSLVGVDWYPGVRELAIVDAPVRYVEPIARLEQLEWLSLAGCKLVTDVAVLAGMPNLRHLDLTGCDPDLDLSVFAERDIRVIPPGRGSGRGFARRLAATMRRRVRPRSY